jgi:hypothetical protein
VGSSKRAGDAAPTSVVQEEIAAVSVARVGSSEKMRSRPVVVRSSIFPAAVLAPVKPVEALIHIVRGHR